MVSECFRFALVNKPQLCPDYVVHSRRAEIVYYVGREEHPINVCDSWLNLIVLYLFSFHYHLLIYLILSSTNFLYGARRVINNYYIKVN